MASPSSHLPVRNHDLLGDWRRQPATGRLAAEVAAVLDEDGHSDLRRIRRAEGHEPGMASVGSRLGTSLMSSGGASPKPKSLAVLASAPGGSWVASLAKYTLQDWVSAWVMSPPQTSLPKFLIGMLVWAGRNCPAAG